MVKLKLKHSPTVEAKPDHLGPTERRWMSHKSKDKMFDTLTVMAEGNNRAFDILMLFFEQGADPLFHEMAITLDDMNIRGDQIVLAYDKADQLFSEIEPGMKLIDKLIIMVRYREPKMISYINAQWKKAFMEQAVPSGAHRWMHKKIVTPPNG